MVYDNDVYLTPEQVAEKLQLAVETVYRWLRSGKLRGSRISAKAWRVAERDVRSFVTKQNVSELLFEEYVGQQNLGTPDREPIIPGKTKRIDYRLAFKGRPLWFEVKEFAEDQSLANGNSPAGFFDPYVAIRNKIDKASEKFGEYGEECCSLILYNRNLNLVYIYTPEIVFGAMLGNVSWRIPMDFQKGVETGPPRRTFSDGGKLIHPHTKAPQNTRICALIALERFAVGQRQFRIELKKKEQEEERRLTAEEFHKFYQSHADACQRTALRVLVYENPYAKQRLPNDLFTGPFDELWGPIHNQADIKRLYIGRELANLEAAEHQLELDLGPLQRRVKPRRRDRGK
jgi:excisionase family DNA binding protein